MDVERAVISRNFGLPTQSELPLTEIGGPRGFFFVNKKRMAHAMVPFADLLNHSVPPSVRWKWTKSDNRKGFIFTAIKDIAKGEEMFNSYGDTLANYELLVNYGFVLPNNIDKLTVSLKGVQFE